MDLPKPPKDRRLNPCSGDEYLKTQQEAESNYSSGSSSHSSANEESEEQKAVRARLEGIVKLQNNQLRDSLRNFLLLERSLASQELPPESVQLIPSALNIMLFGPSGAGKSSLVKTLYLALNNRTRLPERLQSDLKIPLNEGDTSTQQFTRVVLKDRTKRMLQVTSESSFGASQSMTDKPNPQSNTSNHLQSQNTLPNFTRSQTRVVETTQVNVIDTRGQIGLNAKELKQLELMVDGRVKNHSLVEQRSYRYAYLLWEFWKRDSELFPEDILSCETIESRPHALIFVFDGSSESVPRSTDETHFYREVIANVRTKNHISPQIVLTRVDKIEDQVQQTEKHLSRTERQNRVREIVDAKLEQVVHALGVPRASVHFIENYNARHANLEQPDETLNYYALRLLQETLKQGEAYVQRFVQERSQSQNSSCSVY